MAKQSVQLISTALRSAEYDDESETLTVRFMSGQDYTFDNVPQNVFEGLRDARSPGSFFHQNIKGVY